MFVCICVYMFASRDMCMHVCMDIFVCTHMFVCMCVCAHARAQRAEIKLKCISLKVGLLSLVSLGPRASKLQGSTCLCFPSTESTCTPPLWLFVRVLGIMPAWHVLYWLSPPSSPSSWFLFDFRENYMSPSSSFLPLLYLPCAWNTCFPDCLP